MKVKYDTYFEYNVCLYYQGMEGPPGIPGEQGAPGGSPQGEPGEDVQGKNSIVLNVSSSSVSYHASKCCTVTDFPSGLFSIASQLTF